jgi:hypothetical protein
MSSNPAGSMDVCSTYGRKESCIQGLVEGPDGQDHLKDLDVDGRIILKLIFKK